MKKFPQNTVLTRFRDIHGNKYDYSEVEYFGKDTKVEIVCREHGEFFQSPHNHYKGQGCPTCGLSKQSTTSRLKLNEFKLLAKAKHGDKYSYDKVVYVKSDIKIQVGCILHGEFSITPAMHLSGQGCMACGRLRTQKAVSYTQADFTAKATEVHKNKYNYSLVNYVRSTDKVTIICELHGNFMQEAASHLTGVGCPSCSETGFDKTGKGYVYVLSNGELTKVGITNRNPNYRAGSVSRSLGSKFSVLWSTHAMNGDRCRGVESSVLKFLRANYQNPSIKFDGYSESFVSLDPAIVVMKIEEIIGEYEREH